VLNYYGLLALHLASPETLGLQLINVQSIHECFQVGLMVAALVV